MLKLPDDLLDRGLNALLHHGYSDFLPEPPEFSVVKKHWPELRAMLADENLLEHTSYRPLFTFAPKSKINLRPVTLLHPIDGIIYSSLTISLRDGIEQNRIAEDKHVVFSFRSKKATGSVFYNDVPSHDEFADHKLERAKNSAEGYMAVADIADFYPRLYQHRVRNALHGCVRSGQENYPAAIERLLRATTHDKASFGIPIGPAASRLLAEAALIDVDSQLQSFGIDFIRYIDDFVIYAESREKIEWALRTLGMILMKNHGLSLQSAKTEVISCEAALSHKLSALSSSEAVNDAFDSIVGKRFYEVQGFDDLSNEEKDLLNTIDLGKILTQTLDEEEVDYKKVAFILDKLSSLQRPDLIPIVLEHLHRLYPVAHSVHAFFRDLAALNQSDRDRAADALLDPVKAVGFHKAPEYYAIWILDLFRLNPAWNHKATLQQIFRETESQAIRRYAALAIGSAGTRAEALMVKDAIHAAEPLTRTALILASKKLGLDERKHWLNGLDLDPFESFLRRNG